MYKIDGEAMISALNTLALVNDIASSDPQKVYRGDEAGLMVSALNDLVAQLEILNTRLAFNMARRILLHLEKVAPQFEPEHVAEWVSRRLDELRARLQEELADKAIYHVPPDKAQLIADAELSFGQAVVDCFPDMNMDLGEAATCLALSRSTACVFHLMRAVESAVAEIGKRLGATIVDKNNVDLNWGVIIANMNAVIEAMPKVEEKDYWSEVASHLFHVKNTWRNKTMHPKRTYTDNEAVEVFSAVKTFLRCLAEEWST